ncbi:aminotransferase class V-fold PLP-dependent enzyme [Solitalea canadensis]|uniref:Cysteine desulfurase n=1 Tax=Solitalea canadensis (strain ATCC 29591 / DSM 3403 / JCM 21819 / LMG 8368 / NBRC 15130 / NCIMB 12057 / USAM 9D) TaxID=929556 RepID=H8KUZ4_SOLCM|nr:cysteine desulfurase [Solitalea canadensis]AFD07694.1 cysteine desulfurase-like protein, SufS subfamily [Solitalea canadensis DSM 3403]
MKDQLIESKFNVEAIRKVFPVLNQEINGYPLIYFDNAATSQKPQQVTDVLLRYYHTDNANIHRGIHTLAERATSAFEETREAVKDFIHAAEVEEIIFTKGTTEGINLVAQTFGKANLIEGDEVIISTMEHHSNIVPWQMICNEKGAKLKILPITNEGELIWETAEQLITSKTKIVALVFASNSLGSINPVQKIIELAHNAGAKVLLDAAQAAAHLEIDVQKLDCDFLVFSGHKIYGPTGVGVLYGKRALLEAMPPYQGGGEMIQEVTFEKTTYNELPYKFEAGTPNIADVIALQAAIHFINKIGKEVIAKHEHRLMVRATEGLKRIPEIKLIGTTKNKIGIVSFLIEGMHHLDVGIVLDAKGIAIRTGHHCTQPLMNFLKIEGTCRASFAVYNTEQEVDFFLESVARIVARRK